MKIGSLTNIKNPKMIAAALAFVVICILVIINCVNLFFSSNKLKDEIDKDRLRLESGKSILTKQGPLKSKLEGIKAKLDSTEAGFSANPEEIFLRLNRSAAESNVTLKTITPLDKKSIKIPDSEDMYIELPVTLKLKSGYQELVSFLRKIEKLNKIIALTEIRIQPDPQNIWKHDVDLSVAIPITVLRQEPK